jgi:hypothetical protein
MGNDSDMNVNKNLLESESLPSSKDYLYLGLLRTLSIPVSIHFRIVRAHKVFPNLPMHDDTKVDKFYFHVQFSNEHCRRKLLYEPWFQTSLTRNGRLLGISLLSASFPVTPFLTATTGTLQRIFSRVLLGVIVVLGATLLVE